MIGPTLPPHLKREKKDEAKEDKDKSYEKDEQLVGPDLPNSIKKSKEGSEKNDKMDRKTKKVIGPTLPPHLTKSINEETDDEILDDVKVKDDDKFIGPIPTLNADNDEDLLKRKIEEFDRRANPQKESTIPKRAEWMTVPPESGMLSGDPLKLMGRKFNSRNNELVKENNLWTETPQEREERIKYGKVKKSKLDDEINIRKEEVVSISNRGESLLEQHRKKIKKEKAKGKNIDEDDPTKRKFDWEKDMKVNLMDPKRNKALLDGSMKLSDRFSKGK